MKLYVYLEPEQRHELRRILVECHYAKSTSRVEVKHFSAWLMRFHEEGGMNITCSQDLLYRGQPHRNSYNQEKLDLPHDFIHNMLHYWTTKCNLTSWDQVLMNIALHNIVPVNGYPRIGPLNDNEQQAIIERLERSEQEQTEIDLASRANKGKFYNMRTFVSMPELQEKDIFPIGEPEDYYDDRPLPTSPKWRELGPLAPSWDLSYAWYVPDFQRLPRNIFILDSDVGQIEKLAVHYHITQIHKKTPAVLYCLVLEALCMGLLKRQGVPPQWSVDNNDNSA